MQNDREKVLCIYCNNAFSTPKGDHIPPQCFFPPRRGYELLNVPCCIRCNNKFSNIDEKVWTAWTSLEDVEKHPVVRDIIQPKIRREWERKIGKQINYTQSIILPDRPLTSEEYLTAPDIQLRIEPEVIQFLGRMTSALTYCDQGFCGGYDTEFLWQELDRKHPGDYDNLFFNILLPTREPISIGGDIFRYCTFVFPQARKVYCWMKFYDSIEFGTMLILPERMVRKVDDVYLLFPDEAFTRLEDTLIDN